jgi:hypothetical protein
MKKLPSSDKKRKLSGKAKKEAEEVRLAYALKEFAHFKSVASYASLDGDC